MTYIQHYPVGAGVGAKLLEQFELAYRRRRTDGAFLRVLARSRRRSVAAALPPQPVLHPRVSWTDRRAPASLVPSSVHVADNSDHPSQHAVTSSSSRWLHEQLTGRRTDGRHVIYYVTEKLWRHWLEPLFTSRPARPVRLSVSQSVSLEPSGNEYWPPARPSTGAERRPPRTPASMRPPPAAREVGHPSPSQAGDNRWPAPKMPPALSFPSIRLPLTEPPYRGAQSAASTSHYAHQNRRNGALSPATQRPRRAAPGIALSLQYQPVATSVIPSAFSAPAQRAILFVMRPSLGGPALSVSYKSVFMSIPCLRFTWSRKAIDTSNLVEI